MQRILAPVLLAWMGCTADVPDTSNFDAESVELYGGARWKTDKIPVCWENPQTGNADERELVRKRIENSWDRVAAIDFVGWGACKEGSKGIRVRIADERPHVLDIGRKLDGLKGGMVLNFAFKKWSVSCQKRRKYCIRAIAVHEFGHALGFFHEQDRPDNPKWCTENVVASKGITFGPYDIHSVMNYCNEAWNNDGELSAFDIKGVRKAYGDSGASGGAEEPEDGDEPIEAGASYEPLSNDVEAYALPEEPTPDDGTLTCADSDCDPPPPEESCSTGQKQCVNGDQWNECNGGSWSGPYSCSQSYPGTICGDGYCIGCSPGQKVCVDGDHYLECGGSLWVGPYSCTVSWPGTQCSEGYCVYL